MSKNVIETDDSTFQREVLDADLPVLVEFGATWCPPCRALEPIVEQLATETAGTYKFAKIDTDDAPETAKRYGIRGVPVVMVFKKGERVAQHLGLTNRATLLNLLKAP